MDKIKFMVANPGGNITIFVLSPVERKDYHTVAHKLLAQTELKGEQVGFIKSIGEHNVLEMCGLEFCGNAGRAFGLYVAQQQGLKGQQTITIEESGADTPLQVQVNVDTGYTKIKMPQPLSVREWGRGMLVDLGGIVHIVLKDMEPSVEKFEQVKTAFYADNTATALGVMFYNTQTETLTPVVYVDSVQTTYWEGSCGSGSLATAIVLNQQEDENGSYSYSLQQPAGTIISTLEKHDGTLIAAYIEGIVTFSEVYEL